MMPAVLWGTQELGTIASRLCMLFPTCPDDRLSQPSPEGLTKASLSTKPCVLRLPYDRNGCLMHIH